MKFEALTDVTVQACSSGGERYLDTVEVGGSKPPTPTSAIAAGHAEMTFLLRRLAAAMRITCSAV